MKILDDFLSPSENHLIQFPETFNSQMPNFLYPKKLKTHSSENIIDWFSINGAQKLSVWVETIFFYRRPFPTTHIKKISNEFSTFHNFHSKYMATLRPSVQKCFIYGTIMKRKKSTHFIQQGIQNEMKKILKLFAYQQFPFRRKPRSFERWEHPRSLHRCICQTCWFPLEILLHDSHLTLLSATMNCLFWMKEKIKWKIWIHKMKSKKIFSN